MNNPEKFRHLQNLPKNQKRRIEIEIEKTDKKEKDGIEKVQKFIAEVIVSALQKEGVPLDQQARIKMEAFENVCYSSATIIQDKKTIKSHLKEWYPELSQEEIEEKRSKKEGERLEILKTAIFHKNFHSKFIVVRSSSFDDKINQVDNIIIERETGNIVCALDEVAETKGYKYEEKKNEVLRKNSEGGAELKYGLLLKKKEGKMQVKLSEVSNLPVFYLALSKNIIEKGLSNFQNSLSEQSNYEKDLFKYFIMTLKTQIQYLLLSPNLHPEVEKRIQRFQETLKGSEV